MAIVTAVALLLLYGLSLPAVVDYVTFMKVQSHRLSQIRFDWLFSIYVIFAVAVLIRYAWILWWALRGRGPEAFDPTKASSGVDRGAGPLTRRHEPADPFTLCIVAIVGLSLLGLPIGHAMIGGSILYLWLAGLDMGTAAEQLLNGMYTSYILLAVPLFIFAAEIMNSGSMTERLLLFCDALVGRFRGGLAQVNVLQIDHLRRHVRLGHRRRRRQRQADADDDDQRTASTRRASPRR